MTEIDRRARIAGGVYLLSAVPAVFSLMYVPGQLIVHGDMAETIRRILASEALFRWGMVAEIAGAVIWVFVMRALYRLLVDVDRGQAWLMVALSLMAVPIMALSVLGELAALTILDDPKIGGAFAPDQLHALVGLSLKWNAQAYTVAGVFWGLWLFPFAILVWRSGFLPKFLSILLVIGALGYLAESLTALLAPSLGPVVGPVASLVTGVGELPIMFWLLFMGAKVRPRPDVAGGAETAPIRA